MVETNVPLCWGILIVREIMHVWGQEIYGKSLYMSPNLDVNLKLVLKVNP